MSDPTDSNYTPTLCIADPDAKYVTAIREGSDEVGDLIAGSGLLRSSLAGKGIVSFILYDITWDFEDEDK